MINLIKRTASLLLYLNIIIICNTRWGRKVESNALRLHLWKSGQTNSTSFLIRELDQGIYVLALIHLEHGSQ